MRKGNTFFQWRLGFHLLGIVVVGWLLFFTSALLGPSVGGQLAITGANELTQLSPEEQQVLREQGFVVKPADYDSFAELYQELAADGRPILVTTDAVLHATDVLLKYAAMEIEAKELQPALLELTQRMAQAAQEQWSSIPATSEELKEAALRNWAYFTVAGRLLGDTASIPEQVAPWVEGELALIRDHAGPAESPLFGYLEDYSAYDVWGSPPALQGYLQAVTWYERMMFRLRPGRTEEALARGRRETLQALLIAHALRQDPQALELWRWVYAVTTLLTGEADSLTVEDYLRLMDRIYGYGPEASPEALADEGKLEAFIEGALKLKRPRLIPLWLAMAGVQGQEGWEEVAPGLSFLGWRFSPGDYVFQELTYPNVGTSSRPRELPRGLDLMAALGSSPAEALLEQAGAFLYRDYEEQLRLLQGELAELDGKGLWGRWLTGLRPLLFLESSRDQGARALPAMGHEAWQRKALSTSLATWTLGRHRALSFTNAYSAGALSSSSSTSGSGAGAGAGAEEGEGYVEPYPELYASLAVLIRDFQGELEAAGVRISPQLSAKLSELEGLLLRLEEIARRELAGEPLDPDDYQLIQGIGYLLEELTRMPPPLAEALGLPNEGVQPSLPLVRAAHISYQWERALEVALGKVFVIEALVDKDPDYVVYGGVFSYYEFHLPLEEHLTGERWWEEVSRRGGGLPLPWWTEAYLLQSSEPVPFETIEQGTVSGVTRALEQVIRDEGAWAALWAEHASIFFPPPPQPQLDFSREMAIAVFAGEQPTGGYTVTITEVKRLEGGLKVYYTVEVPGPECFVEQLFTQPFHMIRVARQEGVVVFAPNYEVIHCQ